MHIKFKTIFLNLAFCLFLGNVSFAYAEHEIVFCGEKIPVGDRFVADKLMGTIKKHSNYVNVPDLRQRVNQYMGRVEQYLNLTGLPEDFKYLAIVESGFKTSVSSPVGAVGFWQLMPATAKELGLVINETTDERTDFDKSTYAACKVLAGYYMFIRKKFGISSWVLTAAAYNNGIGRIQNAITKQGTDYFQMQLNQETAAYVYNIIAVKELFEFPELYMQNFGYNIFTTTKMGKSKNDNSNKPDLGGMTIKVDQNDGVHPNSLGKKMLLSKKADPSKIKFVSGQIIGKYKKFKDGDIVSIKLLDNLQVYNRFTGKDIIIQGRGWIIDDRVMIDLGYDHNVILLDLNNQKGVALNSLKNKQMVIMKVNTAK